MSLASDDVELVRKALAGNQQAFAALVSRYKALVFTVVYKVVGDRLMSEDLSQESFVKAYFALDRLRNPKHFKPWLMKIASNEAIKCLRSRSRADLRLDGNEGSIEALIAHQSERVQQNDPQTRAERLSNLERVGKSLTKLPPIYRQALVLRYFAHLSYKEVCEATGTSLATIKFRIHHGMKLLRVYCLED